mmetsp:Transcript_14877/g.21291  ORF Transcript_14877/g.21291 Transcript_14877/m.21291 type:complete len:731 (-) Transcript_14877:51-2243(-)
MALKSSFKPPYSHLCSDMTSSCSYSSHPQQKQYSSSSLVHPTSKSSQMKRTAIENWKYSNRRMERTNIGKANAIHLSAKKIRNSLFVTLVSTIILSLSFLLSSSSSYILSSSSRTAISSRTMTSNIKCARVASPTYPRDFVLFSKRRNNKNYSGRDNNNYDDGNDFGDDKWNKDEELGYNSNFKNGKRKTHVSSSSGNAAGKDENMDTPSHFFSRKSIHHPSFSLSSHSTSPKSSIPSSSSEYNDKIIHEKLCEGAKISKPSRVQALAWPVLLEGEPAIIADQTGSGKTLAYLLPLLKRMFSNEAKDKSNNSSSSKKPGSPKILILAPTTELAFQIHSVCNQIAKSIPFRTKVLTATSGRSDSTQNVADTNPNNSHSSSNSKNSNKFNNQNSYAFATNIRDQIRMLQQNQMDVLVSTPGRIATILRSKRSGNLDLTNLQAIVLDEVDVLLIDDTFGPQLRTIGAAMPVQNTQFVFVTATLPDSISSTLKQDFPNLKSIMGPGLHRVALTLKEHLVDVSVPTGISNRDSQACFKIKLDQLLRSLRFNPYSRTLVFCNTVEICRKVENKLKRNDRKERRVWVGAYHNAMTPEARLANLGTFSRGNNNMRHILVCTDRAARGVDFDSSPVDHVVIFDFPKDPAEYVRRVGRTARAGRTGTSTVFAYGWQLPIARKIMGKKLESYTVAMASSNHGDGSEFDDEEFTAKQRKDKRARGQKEQMIKGNIEKGNLWN